MFRNLENLLPDLKTVSLPALFSAKFRSFLTASIVYLCSQKLFLQIKSGIFKNNLILKVFFLSAKIDRVLKTWPTT